MPARERFLGTALTLMLGFVMLTGALIFVPGGTAALPVDAWITGVVDDGTDPVPDVYIKTMIFTSGGIDAGYAYTDANGAYTIGVMGGFDYMVLSASDSHYMAMTSVSVEAGETAWANMTLDPIAPVVADITIKGYVKDEWGVPATGGHVLGISYDPMGSDMPFYASATSPDIGTGYFEVNVIPSPAGGGAVAFDNEGYSMVENSTESAILSGETYWFNITLVGLSQYEDAAIYGHVTDATTGFPLEGVFVSVEIQNMYSGYTYANYTFTDSAGNYTMNVMNGSARIWFTKSGYSMAMYENEPIPPGADLQYDASLIALDCVVRGNVTDLKAGVPLAMARVIVMDIYGTMVMAMTNDTGYYELNSFSGENLYLTAQADGYSQEYIVVTLNPGDEIWHDFGLYPASAWIDGTVTDVITGLPVEGAQVRAESPTYNDEDSTDASGYYSIPVVPGDYTVRVNTMNYREASADVTVLDETTTVQDFEMIPWDIPETVLVSGYVTDSVSGTFISNAQVRVSLSDMSYWNQTSTDTGGYYEIYVAPLDGSPMGVTAYAHGPFYTTMDCAGLSTLVLDVQLAPDPFRPNMTYAQSPLENISWTNPMTIDAEVEDAYMRQIVLWNLMPWYSEGGFDHRYVFSGASVSFDPFNPSGDLEYTQVGDSYFINEVFDGTLNDTSMIGGWLDNGTDMSYMSSYKQWWGPDLLYAIRAYYSNDTLDRAPGAAYFDSETGGYLWFRFDWGFTEAGPDDVTAVIEFTASHMAFEQANPSNWMWLGDAVLCEAGVPDLVFTPDPVVPSGNYTTLFMAGDFGDGWNWSVTSYTVDNGVPVADAGVDHAAVIDVECTLNGSGSSDDVGIVSFTWEFDDGGPVTLYGETVDYTFTALGTHDVTLTVVDGAGHESVDTVVIYVNEDMPPLADAGYSFSVDEDALATFDGSNSSDDVGITNYTWTIVDLSVEMYDEFPSYTFTEPGLYDVELVVTDTLGQLSDPDTTTVTVLDITSPVADAGEDQDGVPYGDLVLLNASLSDDNVDVESWTWAFDDDGPQALDGELVSYTFTAPGTFNITLTVADAAGNEDTDLVVVTVVDGELPVANAGADPEGVVVGQIVKLNGSASTDNHLIADYTWSFNDSEEVFLDGPVAYYTFMTEGEYEVTLTVVDASGNSDTDTVVVRVGPANEAPVADAGDDQLEVVEGDTVTFDGGGSSDDVDIVTYTWTFTYDGEKQTIVGEVVTFEFEIPGTYIVTLNVTDAEGEWSTDTLVVVVSEKASTFMTEYWWLLAVVAAVAVIAALVLLMKRGKGGSGKDADEGEEFEEEEELPPPDADDV